MIRKEFAVLGLGEFGRSVAVSLERNGCEVLAVDINAEKVNAIADYVTHAVRADAADPGVIRSLGISNLDGVVVSIGENLEASIMATIVAKECGVPYILAKAGSDLHAEVLKKVGADKVVFPEREMGNRAARNIISGNFVDMIELSKEFTMVEIVAPASWEGKNLRNLNLRRAGLNIIARKDGEKVIMKINPDRIIEKGDLYVVVGENDSLRRLYG